MIVIEMENGGKIELELLPEYAPNTAKNFLWLASQGFYDGLIFHRAIKGFVIQSGCPQGTGMGDPGHHIKGEFKANGWPNDLKHTRGVLSMARAASYDSGGSQFFIMHADSPTLDGSYAAFGRVVSGMEVVDAIATTETNAQDRPLTEQRIKSVTVVDEGEIGEPEKL